MALETDKKTLLKNFRKQLRTMPRKGAVRIVIWEYSSKYAEGCRSIHDVSEIRMVANANFYGVFTASGNWSTYIEGLLSSTIEKADRIPHKSEITIEEAN